MINSCFYEVAGEGQELEFVAALEPAFRYGMLASILYVSVRMLLAMFFAKTSDPVRGKLTAAVSRNAYTLYDRETSVGRAKTCDIVLPFETVSRLHAVIAYRSHGFVIFDTFSRSGVKVNGTLIEGKSYLHDGDVVNIGGLDFVLSETKYKFIKDKSGALGSPSYGFALIVLAVFNLCALLLNLSPDGKTVSWTAVGVYVAFIALQWAYYFFASIVLRQTSFEPEMIAFAFTSVGLALVGSIHPEGLFKQFLCVVIGVVGYCVLLSILRFPDAVKKLRWAVAGATLALLGVTLVVATPNNGALNWISLGSISLQPSELAKAAFIFVGAVTLEKLQSIRHLTMFLLFAGACIGELFRMNDFGAALIFFFVFLVIAFMRSGDFRTLILICMGAALGAGLILYFKPYVANRFATYLHVWELMDEGGYQQTRSLIYSASGGLFGLGLGNGYLREVFASCEDLAFGVVCEEFGIIMGFLIPLVYAAVVVKMVVGAKKARSSYYAIASVAAASLILFQSMLSIFGITDLLPMTGVTVPFVSKGGTSMISSFLLLAFIKSADVRTFASFRPQLQTESPLLDRKPAAATEPRKKAAPAPAQKSEPRKKATAAPKAPPQKTAPKKQATQKPATQKPATPKATPKSKREGGGGE